MAYKLDFLNINLSKFMAYPKFTQKVLTNVFIVIV